MELYSCKSFVRLRKSHTDIKRSIAGTETTAGFLTGLFNQIMRTNNKHILDKLTQEIRSNFKSDADLKFEELIKLPYLTAVIEEGLRIFPSAPIGFVRTVPQGGDTVVGEVIPEGVSLRLCCPK
jgi:cytochrome P450